MAAGLQGVDPAQDPGGEVAFGDRAGGELAGRHRAGQQLVGPDRGVRKTGVVDRSGSDLRPLDGVLGDVGGPDRVGSEVARPDDVLAELRDGEGGGAAEGDEDGDRRHHVRVAEVDAEPAQAARKLTTGSDHLAGDDQAQTQALPPESAQISAAIRSCSAFGALSGEPWPPYSAQVEGRIW